MQKFVYYLYKESSYLKKMMDLLWSRFIRDLVGGSNRLLGYKNKSGAKFC